MAILGCDLSHWDQDVDFGTILTALKAQPNADQSRQFIALKCSQGTGNVDPTFADRRARAHTAGVPLVLLYHFLEAPASSTSGTDQAEHFSATVGDLAANEMIALDVEQAVDNAAVASDFVASVKETWSLTDDDVIFYGSPGWLRENFGSPLAEFTGLKLWAAEYAPALGDVSPWAKATIWQNSERATVEGAGAPGTVDSDVWIAEDEWPV